MGMFSWNCLGCDHPIFRNDADAIKDSNLWMTEVVIMDPLHYGETISGEYDGYGSVITPKGNKIDITPGLCPIGKGLEPTCWHRDCWLAAGEPHGVTPSKHSRCQAWFCDGEMYDFVCDHDMESPLNKNMKPTHKGEENDKT